MTHPQALGPKGLMHVYECFPPDLLHTLCGGVVRYACVWSLEVIKVSRSYGLTRLCAASALIQSVAQMLSGQEQIRSIHTEMLEHRHGAATDGEFNLTIPSNVSIL
jgi:hypothetical protein